MLKKYFFSGVATIITLFLLSACFSHVHDSNVSCDITIDKEYIIKWDVFPKAVGDVKIYISDNPETFNTRQPVAVVDAADGVAFLPTPDPLKRHYFLLDFNGCFSRIVAARASFVQSAYDFRDLGGYSGVNNKKTKWGMIYRTGTLDTLSELDKQRIINIAPKTIIEYRDRAECSYSPTELGVENVVYMPFTNFNVDSIINKVYNGDFSRDEAR
ncbi:MAG: tyrosine-protein phosphatase, partial [Muribaculaceae bacterium]|nr:tyrosine-protein phosphatase [Muribaculaceae bacterium]